jgi:hypothetical protein
MLHRAVCSFILCNAHQRLTTTQRLSFVDENPATRFVLTSSPNLRHGLVSMSNLLQYDPNAIRVDNVVGDQIGHLPRKIVEKIAPYVVRSYHIPVINPISDTTRTVAMSSSKLSSTVKKASMTAQLRSSSTALATRLSAPGSRTRSRKTSWSRLQSSRTLERKLRLLERQQWV